MNLEQKHLCSKAASSSLSVTRLQQKLILFKRYYIALNRYTKTLDLDTLNDFQKKQSLYKTNPYLNQNPNASKTTYNPNYKPQSHLLDPTLGLARVGSRAALNFSFAFLKRAWRLGEDVDLCNELLAESLAALQVIPVATLFDDTKVSPIWLDIVERSVKFLRQVVTGDLTNNERHTASCAVPLQDQHTSLCLLLELALQKGSLSSLLDVVLLLLNLWNRTQYSEDNRGAKPDSVSAPLLPFLKRFWRIGDFVEEPGSTATDAFLRFLHLPDDDRVEVDLRQAAVIVIAHLDRLAVPHIPLQTFSSKDGDGADYGDQASGVQVSGWGCLSWLGAQDALDELPVQLLCCSEKIVLVLSNCGALFSMIYESETQFLKVIDEFDRKEVIKIASHFDGKHFLALARDGEVYSWGNGDGGRLGEFFLVLFCISW